MGKKRLIEEALIEAEELERASIENATKMVVESFQPSFVNFFKDVLKEVDDDDMEDEFGVEPEEDEEELDEAERDAGKDPDAGRQGTDPAIDDEDESLSQYKKNVQERKIKLEIDDDDKLHGDQDELDADGDGDIDADDFESLRNDDELEEEEDPDEEEIDLDIEDDEEGGDEELDFDSDSDDEEGGDEDFDSDSDDEEGGDEELDVPDDLFDEEGDMDDNEEDEVEFSEEFEDEDDEEIDLDIEDDEVEDTESEFELDTDDEEEFDEGLYIRKEGKFVKTTPAEALRSRITDIEEENRQLTAAYEAINGQLKETHLFNAKLAHLNKLYMSGVFNNKEKQSIAERLDECDNIDEVKGLYKKIVKEVKDRNPLDDFSSLIKETRAAKGAKTENIYESADVIRMRKLAGIIK